MFRKILFLGVIGAILVTFIGTDVVHHTIGRARTAIRDSLTADIPLRTQLAEAQAQVDAYAESIIRGEVAAENLAEMIGDVDREVRVLAVRVDRERDVLVSLRRDLEVVPTSTAPSDAEDGAHRHARTYRAHSALLERRQQDLLRLHQEHAETMSSLEEARSEQARLAEEVTVLAAEIESLEARTAAARTRKAVGDAHVSSSGYAEASERLDRIRDSIRERNKLLEYYEYERRPVTATTDAILATGLPGTARDAIDEALAAYPAR